MLEIFQSSLNLFGFRNSFSKNCRSSNLRNWGWAVSVNRSPKTHSVVHWSTETAHIYEELLKTFSDWFFSTVEFLSLFRFWKWSFRVWKTLVLLPECLHLQEQIICPKNWTTETDQLWSRVILWELRWNRRTPLKSLLERIASYVARDVRCQITEHR